jgi:hypothetical protein
MDGPAMTRMTMRPFAQMMGLPLLWGRSACWVELLRRGLDVRVRAHNSSVDRSICEAFARRIAGEVWKPGE